MARLLAMSFAQHLSLSLPNPESECPLGYVMTCASADGHLDTRTTERSTGRRNTTTLAMKTKRSTARMSEGTAASTKTRTTTRTTAKTKKNALALHQMEDPQHRNLHVLVVDPEATPLLDVMCDTTRTSAITKTNSSMTMRATAKMNASATTMWL